jgi:hypothetical protein
MDIFIIIWGFALAFIAWILGKCARFVFGAANNPSSMDF